MNHRSKNWVFLGDSLTEGIGSERVSYITELVRLLSAAEQRKPCLSRQAIHEFRLREMQSFNHFARFNVAGLWERSVPSSNGSLWLWNLAMEARTIENDVRWLPLIENLRPELVVIYRGSLESIIRPAVALEGNWPWWVPRTWWSYAALDPRCYFSRARWRQAKQRTINSLKQTIRRHFLQKRPGRPLMVPEMLIKHYRLLLDSLRGAASRILILGLIPPDPECFPGSPEQFRKVNKLLHELEALNEDIFFDWAPLFEAKRDGVELWYEDGFHPNSSGNKVLAEALYNRLGSLGFPPAH